MICPESFAVVCFFCTLISCRSISVTLQKTHLDACMGLFSRYMDFQSVVLQRPSLDKVWKLVTTEILFLSKGATPTSYDARVTASLNKEALVRQAKGGDYIDWYCLRTNLFYTYTLRIPTQLPTATIAPMINRELYAVYFEDHSEEAVAVAVARIPVLESRSPLLVLVIQSN